MDYSVDGHWYCLHFGDILNNPTMNISVKVSWFPCALILSYILRNRIAVIGHEYLF